MINFENIKLRFSKPLLCVLVATALQAHAINRTVDKEKAEVDEIALEVQKINSVAEAIEAKDTAYAKITSHRTTLRQIRRDSYLGDDAKQVEETVRTVEGWIADQQRKIELLNERIELLKPVEEEE